MIELTSLQQILSMSSGPEKIQQVQQQQPDTQGRQFAAEFRETADMQKNKVKETEQGNESNLVGDKKERRRGRRRGRRGQGQDAKNEGSNPEPLKTEEVRQGKIVDILI